MDNDYDLACRSSIITSELCFLIQRFLSATPLKRTFAVLNEELQEHLMLPKRVDWEGNEHERSIEDLERQYPHIGPHHLLQICARIGPILEKECPSNVKGIVSLLGAGRQSLLRTREKIENAPKLLRYYATRLHQMPILDPPLSTAAHNIVKILIGRQMSGLVPRGLLIACSRYSQMQLQRQTLGHLSAVYCILFDHTGRYIITGADDLLIKLWSAINGRLIATFRGASAEITDIAINLENTLLAAGSIDRILRVWDLQNGAPIAVLTTHTGMITSVNFCPSARWDVRYLITTSTDGSVAFWTYSLDSCSKPNFMSKPILYQERMRPGQAQMICSSFSPGGTFLATGSADHHVRVYHMKGDEGPYRILETEAHTDRVDSIQWAHQGLKFLSGSKDGTANIWHFESQQWRSLKLSMATRLASSKEDNEDAKKLKVTMVGWDCSDQWVITAVSDYSLKIWRSSTGALEKVLTGHTDEIYVLESHPHDTHVVLSAGHDGQLFIWDIIKGEKIMNFTNNIEGQGYGAVFDVKWSPDGSMIAASDSHGHILMYGFGSGNPQFQKLPKELFFHTDYRPLVRDANHTVLDEQTQIPPHLMPPPFLVDIDGNPYPPMLQRLVPGREHCQAEQLVPNIVVGTGGNQEVIEGLPYEQPRSDIDRMIAALAQRQLGQENVVSENDAYRNEVNSTRHGQRTGMRRNGDIEGIRQTTGNWQRDSNFKWVKHVLMQPLGSTEVKRVKDIVEATGAAEIAEYRREMRHRPVMISTAAVTAPSTSKNHAKRRNRQVVYHTRSTRLESTGETAADAEAEQAEAEDASNTTSNSDDSTAHEEDLSSSDSSSGSSQTSGYSDWVADHGVNLEPPKRSKRKPLTRCVATPPVNNPEEKKTAPATTTKTTNKKKVINIPKLVQGEIPDSYKPSEWLAETKPRKAPYCPQMGDEIVYFRQGHQLYVDAVQNKKVYEVNPKDLPWNKADLKDCEFAKVVGIKYEIRPPRLCCLKLALLDGQGGLTDNVFTVKYHDMADVLDFFVLKQTYETAMSRNWNNGDKFRCMIEDCWWTGEIVGKSPLSEEFSDSLFMCYDVRWDNGEYEKMSPWDLEPVSEQRQPEAPGEAVPVLPEEIQNILYQPQAEEWPRGDRDAACRRILAGLDQVMGLAIAEPFLAPVDLSYYPTYAFVVEYPIDLSTIKARFENHFYRRITSAQFDIRYLATNAEKFNEPHSVIVKHARIITELCLKIVKGSAEEIDVAPIYHQLVDTYVSSESDVDVETQPGPSTQVTTRATRILPSRHFRKADDWKHEARALLEMLWHCEDSAPFRAPVDHIKHPDYYQVIDTPMDLRTVREDLLGGNYETPLDFCKDMRLIFQNSRNYNTNKRSRIYVMTVRLFAMFEEHISKIIYNWKVAKRRENMQNGKQRRSSRKQTTVQNGNNYTSSDSDEESSSSSNNSGDELPQNERVNGFTRYNQMKMGLTLKAIHVPRSSASDEGPSTSFARHKSDSEESYKPNARKRKKKFRVEDTSSTSDVTGSDDDDDDSDNQPLSVHTNKRTTRLRPKTKKTMCVDEESSDSDGEVNKMRTRQCKRPRYLEESDSDCGGSKLVKATKNGENNDDSNEDCVLTVSSRGRVRRMTARVRALLKK